MRLSTLVRWIGGGTAGVGLSLLLGCGTTRTSDTTRTATEQLLISNAIDQSVERLDFQPLKGKTVFFDTQYLDGTVDKGYLVSSIRQHLLATGCLLQEDRKNAAYVVEARAGGVGTDRHQVVLGVPQMQMPVTVPGAPSAIPEIPLAKKTDQLGVAKIALFAYNRVSGQAVMQSGMMETTSTAKDLWVFGAGPFQNGTIRRGIVFAGQEIPDVVNGQPAVPPKPPSGVSVVQAAFWAEKPATPLAESAKPKEQPKPETKPTEVKPTEVKPTEVKPPQAKAVESQPPQPPPMPGDDKAAPRPETKRSEVKPPPPPTPAPILIDDKPPPTPAPILIDDKPPSLETKRTETKPHPLETQSDISLEPVQPLLPPVP